MVNASAMPSGSAEEDGAFVFGSSRALERQVLGPLEEGIVVVLVVVERAVERSVSALVECRIYAMTFFRKFAPSLRDCVR